MNASTQQTYFTRTEKWIVSEYKKWLNKPKSDARQRALCELSVRAELFLDEYRKFEKIAYGAK